ncbi:MAG: SCO4848 family membrane protein [Leucobacter sp.]
MVVFAGILLLINAAYNVLVWPRFWTRVAADPRARDEQGRPTKFLTVHAVLISVALLIAAVSAVAGVLVLTAG